MSALDVSAVVGSAGSDGSEASAAVAASSTPPSSIRSDAQHDRDAARTDRSGQLPTGSPRWVVTARTVADVQETLVYAHAHRIPVVTRGAASGLAGGAIAGEGAIVLDVSRLDRILDIDAAEGLARVEPGVITAELDRRAAEHGLFYAPDPGSVAISTIGGNIATNAGGLRGAKYGVTRDAVLGLDVVLADGSLVHLGRSTLKGVTGYDLVGLVVGSEGTLGVVVGATLRLLPKPTVLATAAAFFRSITDAAEAASAIARSGTRPTVLEIVDGATLGAIDDATGSAFRAAGEAFLLVQTDGFGAEAELAVIVDVIRPLATSVESTTDPAEADRLLAARRQALPSIERLGRVVIEDIAVPRTRLAEAIAGVHTIAEETGARIFVFAHAGDGNLHPIILVGGDRDEPLPAEADAAADSIFALALRLGGTLTAEHGIGLLKQSWVGDELGASVHELQRRVKAVFDPLGILNPGKAI